MQKTDEQMNNGKKVIYGFDLLKFIMALFIVSIHTRAFNDMEYSEYIRIIQTWCVPTFFFLSSYFIMKKFVNSDNSRIKVYTHFIKRLGILYILWFVINIPIFIRQHDSSIMSAYDVIIDFVKNILFASTFEGSWFLSALGLSVSLLFLFACLGINKWVIFSIFTFVYIYIYIAAEADFLEIRYAYDWYAANIYDIPTLSFPRALPFVALGYIMASKSISNIVDRLSGLYIRKAIPILLIALMLISAEVNNLIVEQFVTLLAVPFIVIYFYGLSLSNSMVWKHLRDCSILLYLLHFMIIVYFRHIPVLCQLTGVTKYLAVLSIAGFIGLMIIRLSKMPKTKVLKYLY